MGSFNVQTVLDFHEEFEKHKWALRALSELVYDSKLDLFYGSDSCSDNYRWGLQQLFDMCIENQEKKVDVLKELAINSPEYILERAKNIKKQIDNGSISRLATNNEIMEVIEEIGIVIDLFGQEEYPEAQILKTQILSKISINTKSAASPKYAGNGTDG